MTEQILVVDAGTSSVRVAVFTTDGELVSEQRRATPPVVPFDGLVELDGIELATAVTDLAGAAIADHGPVACGRDHQPAGLDSGVGPRQWRARLGWDRLAGPAHRRSVPGASGRGVQAVAQRVGDQGRGSARCRRPGPGSGLVRRDRRLLDRLDPDRGCGPRDRRLPMQPLPGIAPSMGSAGTRRCWSDCGSRWGHCLRCSTPPRWVRPPPRWPALRRSPRSWATSRRRWSVRVVWPPDRAKVTFGTGGMLDLCTGAERPADEIFSPHGAIPIVTSRHRRAAGLGPGGDHALGGFERGLAARRSRAHRDRGRLRAARRRLRLDRRVDLRAGSDGHRRPPTGTTVPGAPCSGSPPDRRRPRSLGPCWRVSPTGLWTLLSRSRPTPGSRSIISGSTAG